MELSGGGGGAICNNTTTSIFEGGKGGDGIVIIRMATGANYRADSISGASGSYERTAIGNYMYYVYDGAGYF